jgi:RNA-directed DNA polymerase
MTVQPRAIAHDGKRRKPPYSWVIEGDIKTCFDRIDHHQLMERVRARIGDGKVTILLRKFRTAGALPETEFVRTDAASAIAVDPSVDSPLKASLAS